MGKLERVTVTVPGEMGAKLRAAVESGEYATTSDIVLEALSGWEKLQERRQAELMQMKAQIDEGLKSPLLDGPTALAELRAKYRLPSE
ncbi:MAG: transcriptional regulator [Porphyrobacter sp.]|nr:transcriptional regulator [Porphyrobacter sp.]